MLFNTPSRMLEILGLHTSSYYTTSWTDEIRKKHYPLNRQVFRFLLPPLHTNLYLSKLSQELEEPINEVMDKLTELGIESPIEKDEVMEGYKALKGEY